MGSGFRVSCPQSLGGTSNCSPLPRLARGRGLRLWSWSFLCRPPMKHYNIIMIIVIVLFAVMWMWHLLSKMKMQVWCIRGQRLSYRYRASHTADSAHRVIHRTGHHSHRQVTHTHAAHATNKNKLNKNTVTAEADRQQSQHRRQTADRRQGRTHGYTQQSILHVKKTQVTHTHTHNKTVADHSQTTSRTVPYLILVCELVHSSSTL